MAYNITFNGYTLQDASFRTRIIQHTNIPAKIIQSEARARSDGLNVVNVRYGARVIEVEGMLSAASRQALVDKIDEMKLNLRNASGTILVDYGNNTRMYYGTVQELQLPEDFFNITAVPYKVTFYCADPFGYATASGVVTISSQTAFELDTTVTVSGTYTADLAAQLTVNSANNVSTIGISNQTTQEALVISKPGGASFQAGDVIMMDTKNKQIQINGSGVDYTGRFPTITPTSSVLRVSIAATSANWTITYRYLPTYL